MAIQNHGFASTKQHGLKPVDIRFLTMYLELLEILDGKSLFCEDIRHGRLKSWFCIDKTVWFYTGLYTMCFTHVQKPWFLTV